MDRETRMFQDAFRYILLHCTHLLQDIIMRGYAWGNMYLSSIQQGIQGWHANNEIFNKYKLTSPEVKTFLNWNKSHKTLIVLNGGYADSLLAIHNALSVLTRRLKNSAADQKDMGVKGIPVTLFKEEKASLNEAVTSVFTVLPECAYASPVERAALRRELNSIGVYDMVEAALDKRRVVSEAIAKALGHDKLANRFKLISMTGDLAR